MKKISLHICLLILLIASIFFVLCNSIKGFTSCVARGSNLNLLIYEDSGLGFQSGTKQILLTPTSGQLNSSINSLAIYEDQGTFRFLSNETFTLCLTFDSSKVAVEGDNGNSLRYIQSGDSISIVSSDTVTISWVVYVEPFLPMMFILGVMGILSILYGGMYGVREMKKHNYRDALIQAVIFISVGFSLFIAWLWS